MHVIRNSSGVVLFMVLVLTIILYLVVSTLLLITMTEVHLADFTQRSTQAFYAAESSIALGISRLRLNSNYRSDTNDTLRIGRNIGLSTAKFYDGTNDGNGHYRSSLAPSLYHLVLQGVGSVPGAKTTAKRIVERHIVIKPFVLFARQSLTLQGGGVITGNIHGNGVVTIGTGISVTGDVTSPNPVNNNGIVTGTVSSTTSLEPKITYPELSIDRYFPRYLYNGVEYEAQPLVKDTLTFVDDEEIPPPAPGVVDLYSGFPTSDNPAGVFYPDSTMLGPLNALHVNGTVVIPGDYPLETVQLYGVVNILPVANFPALVSTKDLDITLIGNLEHFSESLQKSSIRGTIYVYGNLALTGENTPGEIITGSVFGHTLTLTGQPLLGITYDPNIMSTPPPGLDLIEPGEWKEVFE